MDYTIFANELLIPIMADNKPPKAILLNEPPKDVWEKICETKRKIMENNKQRASVSHEEAIYKLIKNNCV